MLIWIVTWGNGSGCFYTTNEKYPITRVLCIQSTKTWEHISKVWKIVFSKSSFTWELLKEEVGISQKILQGKFISAQNQWIWGAYFRDQLVFGVWASKKTHPPANGLLWPSLFWYIWIGHKQVEAAAGDVVKKAVADMGISSSFSSSSSSSSSDDDDDDDDKNDENEDEDRWGQIMTLLYIIMMIMMRRNKFEDDHDDKENQEDDHDDDH